MLLKNCYKKVLTGFLFFISLFIISISCDSTEPPSNQSLTLKLKDVSCTEAWLQLTTNNIQLPTTINLLKNNIVIQFFNLDTQDLKPTAAALLGRLLNLDTNKRLSVSHFG